MVIIWDIVHSHEFSKHNVSETEFVSVIRYQGIETSSVHGSQLSRNFHTYYLITETDPVAETLCVKKLMMIDNVQNNYHVLTCSN
jgi:hypothetical protein